MKNCLKLICSAICFFTIAQNSHSQTITPDGSEFDGTPIQTAVSFLRINPDARAGGMGDTGLATSPNENAIFWNTAKLPFTEGDGGIALSYTPWLAGIGVDDIHLINAGGFIKTGDELGGFNFLVRYFSLGETDLRFTSQDVGTVVNPQEFALQGGYSRKLGETTGLGVNLKYINSDLASGSLIGTSTVKDATAFAGDLSFYFDPANTGKTADWAFSAGITDLGSKISYLENSNQKDFLPTNFGLGANVDLNMNEYNTLTFALDANKLLVPTPEENTDDNTSFKDDSPIGALFSSWGDAPGGFSEELKEWQVSLGGEYNFDEKFFGRAGYFYENEHKGDRQYATLGAGASIDLATVNFAYMFATSNSNSPLDGTLRFSVEFDINK